MHREYDRRDVQFALVAGAVALVLAFTYGAITYVYRDAPQRGMDPGQWAGIVALTVGLGLIPYLVVRTDPENRTSDESPSTDAE